MKLPFEIMQFKVVLILLALISFAICSPAKKNSSNHESKESKETNTSSREEEQSGEETLEEEPSEEKSAPESTNKVSQKLSTDRCSLPKHPGTCWAAIPRFYFNKETSKCEGFTYGGCKGNANNFKTLTDCQEACSEPEEKQSKEEEVDPKCSASHKCLNWEHSCSGIHKVNFYYYDEQSKMCKNRKTCCHRWEEGFLDKHFKRHRDCVKTCEPYEGKEKEGQREGRPGCENFYECPKNCPEEDMVTVFAVRNKEIGCEMFKTCCPRGDFFRTEGKDIEDVERKCVGHCKWFLTSWKKKFCQADKIYM